MYKNKEDLLVKKSNKSIEYKLEIMSIQQLKIMNLIISLLDNNKKLNEVKKEDLFFKLNRTEILDYLQLEELHNTRFQKDMKDLSKKQIQYISRNNRDFGFYNIFSYISYKNSVLEIQVNIDIVDCFIQLSNQFTQYYFKHIINFKSKYSLLMYELLKKDKHKTTQHNHKERLVYDLDFLFDKLQVTSQSIKQYMNFKRKVLEVVKEEINNKSDMYFDYKVIKEGRKVVSIEITKLYNKKEQEKKDIEVIEDKSVSKELETKDKIIERQKEELTRLKNILQINDNHIPIEDYEEETENTENIELAECF